MAKKEIDTLWAKELAGTPEEQWERAQDEIAIYAERYSKASEVYEAIEDQADMDRNTAIEKAVEAADRAMEETIHDAEKILLAEEKKLQEVKRMYEPIRIACENSKKKKQKAESAERTRCARLFDKAVAEKDEAKAIKKLKQARALKARLDGQKTV